MHALKPHDLPMPRPEPAAAPRIERPLDLAVVIPTFNEIDNVLPLLEKLDAALAGISWEAVFVDDNSGDGTANLLREIGRLKRHVRVVQRIGRRGLSSAVVEGMLATAAPILAVIDADMQHDERLLPELFAAVAHDGCDLAIGSRYIDGGGLGEWSGARQRVSRISSRLADLVLKTPISDPMSGFFVVSRAAMVEALPSISSMGFKILLDLVASSPRPLTIKELPYEFRLRTTGESKLDKAVAAEYALLLLDKLVGHLVPVRFLLFAAVGGVGLFVHLAALGIALKIFGASFALAQAIAVLIAMTANFVLNNSFTYRDRRLRGRRFVTGLLSFWAVCLIGAVANVGLGAYIYQTQHLWWVAGIGGAVVGVVWNYAASSVVTWRR